mgnify:CR=1 FL=1
MRKAVCASSVTVSTATPPIASSAGAPHHRARAAEQARVPQIVAVLDQAVEQLAFIGNASKLPEIALERIGRIEMVRRLDEAEPRIAAEPAERHLQERAGRDVIRVEDGDVLGGRAREARG